MHQKKYAIRITEDYMPLIDLVHPLVEVRVTGDPNRFFLFTIVSPMTTGDHDIMSTIDLYNEDDVQKGARTVIR